MASIGLEIKVDSAEVTRKAVQRIIDEAEWKDDVSEEYKNGFYEFGNAALKFLDKYCEEEKMKPKEPTTVANPDTPTTSCENCAKKSSCKLQNKANFSGSMPKMIVCDEFTPTKTKSKYFTAEQVRNMSQKEVKENYADIMKSMKKW